MDQIGSGFYDDDGDSAGAPPARSDPGWPWPGGGLEAGGAARPQPWGRRTLAGDRASWPATGRPGRRWNGVSCGLRGGPAGWCRLHCGCSFNSLCYLVSNLLETKMTSLGWLVSAGHVTIATVTPAEGSGQSLGSGSTWPRHQWARGTCTVTAVHPPVGTAARRACLGSVRCVGKMSGGWWCSVTPGEPHVPARPLMCTWRSAPCAPPLSPRDPALTAQCKLRFRPLCVTAAVGGTGVTSSPGCGRARRSTRGCWLEGASRGVRWGDR